MALSKLTKVQTLGIGSNIEVVGVITTGQFKSGTSNLHSSGVELTNLNVSGIATIGGNLSIGGTLTYQDVTNIDSVGLITARAGVNVSGGQLDVGSNIKLGNAGVITATSFVGSGANLTSLPSQVTLSNNADNRVITGGSGTNLNGEANLTYNGSILHNQISAGARNDFSTSADGLIIEKGGNTGLSIDPGSSGIANIYFPNESNHSIASISHNNSNGELRFRGEDHIVLSTNNNTERFRIDSAGRCIVGGGTHGGGSALVVKGGNQNTYSTIGMFSNHTNPAVNTLLTQIRFGSNTSAVGADIRVHADADWGTNDYPSRIGFYTAPDGTDSRHERMRITKDGQIRIDQATSANNGIRMRPSGWNYDFRMGAVSSSGGSIWLGQNYEPTGGTRDSASYGTNYIQFTTGGEIHFGTGTTNTNPTARLSITSAGYLQQHKLIAVSYSDTRAISLSNTDLTTSNFYNYTNFASDSSILDSNGHFVAPVHGIYRLYFRCATDGNSGNRANVRLRKNGNTINEAYSMDSGGGIGYSVSSEIIVELNANEYLDIQVAQLHAKQGNQHKVVNFHMLG